MRGGILEAIIELAPVEDPLVLFLKVGLDRAPVLRPSNPNLLATKTWVICGLLDVLLRLAAANSQVKQPCRQAPLLELSAAIVQNVEDCTGQG